MLAHPAVTTKSNITQARPPKPMHAQLRVAANDTSNQPIQLQSEAVAGADILKSEMVILHRNQGPKN